MDKGYVQNTIFELLSRLGIGYEKLEHSPIITMKEGSEIAYKLGSTSCKNLFLCNKRQEYFMLMLPADKKLSAKNVARQIGSPHLSFASAEDMERLLHTYPGAVSVLSLIYDKEKRVQLLTYIIHSGFISGYQNRYGDNLKPPTNVYHRMTA